jgi:hypothetical protein
MLRSCTAEPSSTHAKIKTSSTVAFSLFQLNEKGEIDIASILIFISRCKLTTQKTKIEKKELLYY